MYETLSEGKTNTWCVIIEFRRSIPYTYECKVNPQRRSYTVRTPTKDTILRRIRSKIFQVDPVIMDTVVLRLIQTSRHSMTPLQSTLEESPILCIHSNIIGTADKPIRHVLQPENAASETNATNNSSPTRKTYEFSRHRCCSRLNFGDNANQSHVNRCQPPTDRNTLATKRSCTGQGLQNDQNTGVALRDASTTRRLFRDVLVVLK